MAETVTLHSAISSPSSVATVTVAVPSATAVTSPSCDTETTASLLLLHARFLVGASSGVNEAESLNFSPVHRSRLVRSRVRPMAETVTLHSAVFPPSSDTAEIVAEPALRAVMIPASTEAMFSSLLVQVTFLFVAFSGLTVTVNEASLPSVMVRLDLSSETDSTAMTFGLTVTVHVADMSPSTDVAAMVVIPSETAVTTPSETVATVSSVEDQMRVLSFASFGDTVAERVSVSPSINVASVLSSATSVT